MSIARLFSIRFDEWKKKNKERKRQRGSFMIKKQREREREELNGGYLLMMLMPATCLFITITGSYLRPMLWGLCFALISSRRSLATSFSSYSSTVLFIISAHL